MDEHLVSLLQTIIWAAVALYFGIRFKAVIEGILASIKKRIDDGSGIKSPFMELSEAPKATASEIQAEKLEEAKELLATSPQKNEEESGESEGNQGLITISFDQFSKYVDKYALAQKMALDYLEDKLKVSIFRERRFSGDWLVDGAFVSDGSMVIVEVKMFARPVSLNQLEKMLSQIEQNIVRYNWKNVKIIFIAVIDEGSSVNDNHLNSTWEKVAPRVFPENREATIEIVKFEDLFDTWVTQGPLNGSPLHENELWK